MVSRSAGNDDGYAFQLELVAVAGEPEPRVHFVPLVRDVVWMMRPGVPADHHNSAWPYARIFEHQPPTTICGEAAAGPFDGPVTADHCPRCLHGATDSFAAGVVHLAFRWGEHWLDLPREEALAEYKARWS
jgi:hypothetical protein